MALREVAPVVVRYAMRHPGLAVHDAKIYWRQERDDERVLPKLTEEVAEDVKDSGVEHVLIITDGNRTWATARGLSTRDGHRQGANQLIRVVRNAYKSGIKEFTAWGASPDNINERPEDQKAEIFETIDSAVSIVIPELRDTGGAFHVKGRVDRLPPFLQDKLGWGVRQTEGNHDYSVNLLIDFNVKNEKRATTDEIVQRVAAYYAPFLYPGVEPLNPDEYLSLAPEEKDRAIAEIEEKTKLLEGVQVVLRTGVKIYPATYLSNVSGQVLNADQHPFSEPLPLFSARQALEKVQESARSGRFIRKPGA